MNAYEKIRACIYHPNIAKEDQAIAALAELEKAAAEPAVFRYEFLSHSGWHASYIETRPHDAPYVRNITPLYAAPPAPVAGIRDVVMPDDAAMHPRPAADHEMKDAQLYALALLTEEFGESLQTIGKAGRFGIDTPGVKDPYTGFVDMSITPRTALEKELGDVLAAIEYAAKSGLVGMLEITRRRDAKFLKLTDSTALDNLGKRLAPDVYMETK